MHRRTAWLFILIGSLALPLVERRAVAGPSAADGDGAVELSFRFKPGETTYYTIENEYRDSAAIPPLLSYTAVIREKRYITQTVEAPTASNKSEADANLLKVTWVCNRYEVREKGFGPEASYDSIRDLYPPSPLRGLAGIPGSTIRFLLNPATGVTSKHEIVLGNVPSPGAQAGGSRTADHCSPTVENLTKLLNLLGPYYMPNGPEVTGGRWTKSHVETNANFGDVTTKLTCQMKGIANRGNNQVATIALNGEQSLAAKKMPAPPTAPRPVTTGPTTSAPAARPPAPDRVNKLDKAMCSGSVTFDVTRGRPVEMVLRRETGFLTEMKGPDNKVTSVRMSGAQNFRMTASDTPPAMPKIIGGLKPPIEPDQPKKSVVKAAPDKRAGANQKGQFVKTGPVKSGASSQPAGKLKPIGMTPGPSKK